MLDWDILDWRMHVWDMVVSTDYVASRDLSGTPPLPRICSRDTLMGSFGPSP